MGTELRAVSWPQALCQEQMRLLMPVKYSLFAQQPILWIVTKCKMKHLSAKYEKSLVFQDRNLTYLFMSHMPAALPTLGGDEKFIKCKMHSTMNKQTEKLLLC